MRNSDGDQPRFKPSEAHHQFILSTSLNVFWPFAARSATQQETR
jgi:hypothetical protein